MTSTRVPGAGDDVDDALLALSRVVLVATIRAGAGVTPALSPTQVRTLSLLAEAPIGGLSLTAVAERLSASPSSASRICQRLARDGLVDRAAGPGNEKRFTLTAWGTELLAAVNRARSADLRRLLDALPDARRRAAVEAIGTLVATAADGPAAW